MALGDPYASGDDLADFLKMTVTGNDGWLAIAVAAVSEWIDGYCRRQFNLADTATARTFDVRRDGSVWVDDIGHGTILVATDSASDGTYATEWDDSDFQVDPLNAIAEGKPIDRLVAVGSYTFPPVSRRYGLVQVTARWGWPTVPNVVHQACLIQAARVYKRRESAEGVLGFGEFGPVRVGTRLDPDVELLLNGVRLPPQL